MKNTSLLSLEKLTVKIDSNTILSEISFQLNKNEVLGIVGESGSGKSITALSILNLLNNSSFQSEGSIVFEGIELSNLSKKKIQTVRGKDISIIFQEPMSSLNPSMKCGHQILEIVTNHNKSNKESDIRKVLDLIEKVQLKNPKVVYEKYPHQLSGGQQQRIMIAIAIACNPKILIADEPTTSLDGLVKNEIISLIKSLQLEYKMSVIFISHDLNLVSKFVDNLIILKNGFIIEKGCASKIFKSPKESYTYDLIHSTPPKKNRPYRLLTKKIREIKFIKKEDRKLFHSKIYSQPPILRVEQLHFSYGLNKIINNISFDVFSGEVLGIVGESGSGKSTIAKCILGLVKLKKGVVYFENENIKHIENSVFRKNVQLIFQDPYSSLNSEICIGDSIVEPMIVHRIFKTKKEIKLKALSLLKQVGLKEKDFNKYPNQFSGGQRQRIVIARALALNPRIIVCDESVSALDVSIQAEILNLLNDLKEKFGFTYVFISHDMSVIKYFTDRVIVIKKGKIIELNETDSLFNFPKNKYTKELLKASDF
jgi:peptide/nickel transport system ATP-binding protein